MLNSLSILIGLSLLASQDASQSQLDPNRLSTADPAHHEFYVRSRSFSAPAHSAYQRGELEQAATAYKLALEWDEHDYNSHADLAVVYFKQKKLDIAAKYAKQATIFTPGTLSSMQGSHLLDLPTHIDLLLAQNRFHDALDLYNSRALSLVLPVVKEYVPFDVLVSDVNGGEPLTPAQENLHLAVKVYEIYARNETRFFPELIKERPDWSWPYYAMAYRARETRGKGMKYLEEAIKREKNPERRAKMEAIHQQGWIDELAVDGPAYRESLPLMGSMVSRRDAIVYRLGTEGPMKYLTLEQKKAKLAALKKPGS